MVFRVLLFTFGLSMGLSPALAETEFSGKAFKIRHITCWQMKSNSWLWQCSNGERLRYPQVAKILNKSPHTISVGDISKTYD